MIQYCTGYGYCTGNFYLGKAAITARANVRDRECYKYNTGDSYVVTRKTYN